MNHLLTYLLTGRLTDFFRYLYFYRTFNSDVCCC